MNTDKITRRQARVIPYLLALNVESAAAAAKISKVTLYAWMRQEGFRAALRKAQDKAFSDAIGQLKASVSKAADKLVLLVSSDDTGIALRASVAVIEHAAKLAVTDEFEQRLKAMEELVAARETKQNAQRAGWKGPRMAESNL